MELKIALVLKQRLRGKSLAEVSRATGIPRQRLFDWCEGKAPSLKFAPELLKLATHLNIDLTELLFGVGDKKILSTVVFRDQDAVFRIQIERLE